MTSEQSLDEAPLAVAAASRYAAFISYRHVDPDRWWAKWLHRKLETYPVPRQLVATGSAKRIGRMFRDEEEFAASSDLSLEIDTALEQSRFLIIVCSPRTPDSEWVNQEIVRFAELGRQDRILTLLIEGEPEASFPPALREIRRAAMPQMSGEDEPPDAVEPLAADVRDLVGESSRTVKRLAFLRLAATLLERRFDELRQRDQERRTRQLLQISAALGVLLLGVGLLALFAFQQKLAAEHQRAVAEARMLVSQGEAEFEQEPLAGLRIAAEGLARVPADEAQLSQSLLRRVAVKAAEGRVMKISGDVSDVYHRLPEFPYVLLRNRYTPGVLIHAPDLRVVERIDRLAPQNPLRVTPSLQHYVIAQDGGDGPPYRLISTGNGKLIGRTNSLSGLTLLPNRDPLYFVQDVGISPRVYRLDKGTELGKAGFDIRKISYTPGSAVFAIYYRDDEHTRIPPPPDLFDLKTGQVVETLSRDTGEIWFDGAGTPFYVRALGGAGWQLRRFDVPGDAVAASAEEPYWVSFSRAPTGYWLMGLSKRTQIRRSSDGALIDSL
ncbi:MAG: toll/interleukin-1 receptor domain-containing protein, partial [Chromatiales bacterium]